MIKERYLRTEEYNAFTHVEKYKLWQLRQKRSGGGGGSGDKDRRQLKETSDRIAELQTQMIKRAESKTAGICPPSSSYHLCPCFGET